MDDVHMRRERGEYPLCELGALVQYITPYVNEVTCKGCIKELERKIPRCRGCGEPCSCVPQQETKE